MRGTSSFAKDSAEQYCLGSEVPFNNKESPKDRNMSPSCAEICQNQEFVTLPNSETTMRMWLDCLQSHSLPGKTCRIMEQHVPASEFMNTYVTYAMQCYVMGELFDDICH